MLSYVSQLVAAASCLAYRLKVAVNLADFSWEKKKKSHSTKLSTFKINDNVDINLFIFLIYRAQNNHISKFITFFFTLLLTQKFFILNRTRYKVRQWWHNSLSSGGLECKSAASKTSSSLKKNLSEICRCRVRHSVSAKHWHVVKLSEMHSQVPSRRQLQQRVIIMRVNLKAFFMVMIHLRLSLLSCSVASWDKQETVQQ